MTFIQLILLIFLFLTRRVSSSNQLNLVGDYKLMSINIPKVLVYTYTDGFRHDSIPTAISMLNQEKDNWGVKFDFTEDRNAFRDDNYLKQYDALMFIHATGEVLDQQGQEAFQRYLQSGGNFIGVHAAVCGMYNSSVYKSTIGALFEWHPVIQEATFKRENTTHPATANVPDNWRFAEEVYYFTSDPRENGAVVILSVDESSYNNESYSSNSGHPHPIAWYIDPPKPSQPLQAGAVKGGRSFYTALGHSNETWQNETFINHVFSGLTWALDGASTRSYGSGLVGSEEARPPPPSPPPSSPASSVSSLSDPSSSVPVAGPTLPGHALQVTSDGVGMLGSTTVGVALCFLFGVLTGYYVIA
ncbi:uncharacterized protein IL334_007206 [Kwoniella shivajii]|uniref:ThuA-like domain-containing protein n=1 Tax=Kwoniella shivajii TaxID=564305 RepID=A0ABZ1D821_9TREE|nr:hypothetical protein IL334_007206 [Kwoniella shivajii]